MYIVYLVYAVCKVWIPYNITRQSEKGMKTKIYLPWWLMKTI